ncbi:MAG: hypothetical protein HY553_05295 [Elusimicrobia bacterium]|nr:hypothetical protein [Elusimicrobiota bacterium]
MGTLLVAPERRALAGPLVFLAGPTWTVPWQDEAIRLLRSLAPALHIANPRRPLDTEGDFTEAMYAEQVDWETEHLARAGREGVVLFWLAAEREHRCDRAFAQTTRFELAEWKEKHRLGGARLALGIEAGFTGARYIRRRFAQDCPAVRIQDELEGTCREAVRLARGG